MWCLCNSNVPATMQSLQTCPAGAHPLTVVSTQCLVVAATLSVIGPVRPQSFLISVRSGAACSIALQKAVLLLQNITSSCKSAVLTANALACLAPRYRPCTHATGSQISHQLASNMIRSSFHSCTHLTFDSTRSTKVAEPYPIAEWVIWCSLLTETCPHADWSVRHLSRG